GDGAESAGACADVAQDHERGGAPVPAIEDVWAASFLADRVQVAAAHDLLEVLEVLALGNTHSDPGRDGLVRHWCRDHSLLLAGVHSSRRFLIVLMNWPDIMPSTMRWSTLMHVSL